VANLDTPGFRRCQINMLQPYTKRSDDSHGIRKLSDQSGIKFVRRSTQYCVNVIQIAQNLKGIELALHIQHSREKFAMRPLDHGIGQSPSYEQNQPSLLSHLPSHILAIEV
jgi:hypothetical protein